MTQTVVVAVDWSPVSKRAVEFATEMARAMRARVVLVHVQASEGGPALPETPSGTPAAAGGVEKLAKEWAAQVRNSGVSDVRTVFLDGPPVDAILNYVESNPPDLLVFGRRGHSTGTRMLLGGLTSSVLQHAQCPVLVVP